MKSIHLFISGTVQGVGFRFAAKEKADELGMSGWVKNTPSGRVELVVEGPKEVIEKMINWCYSESPGRVKSIKSKEEKVKKLSSFDIIF